MASIMVLPRLGHLKQLYHMFSYLRDSHNTELVFDPSEPDINKADFLSEEWKDMVYGSCKEGIISNAPAFRGFSFKIVSYVDADHTGDDVTRRSRTGFIFYLNSAPIYWMPRKQTSIDMSLFASECIAIKV